MPVYPGAQDFHLQAIDPARHTQESAPGASRALFFLDEAATAGSSGRV